MYPGAPCPLVRGVWACCVWCCLWRLRGLSSMEKASYKSRVRYRFAVVIVVVVAVDLLSSWDGGGICLWWGIGDSEGAKGCVWLGMTHDQCLNDDCGGGGPWSSLVSVGMMTGYNLIPPHIVLLAADWAWRSGGCYVDCTTEGFGGGVVRVGVVRVGDLVCLGESLDRSGLGWGVVNVSRSCPQSHPTVILRVVNTRLLSGYRVRNIGIPRLTLFVHTGRVRGVSCWINWRALTLQSGWWWWSRFRWWWC